ncbi:acyltransferase [Brachybacterium sp. UMB0905]|uniref:acyltransferase n=1 Tax=Brachybacterium sp. UMB0905 TaxID=2069310 RepID=UPI000C803AEF|nr:acyltransferase [Brachybacterium sp. UMB0905]PMC76516.1 hypothetical protein CJ197_01795 [Brachybacterium sp. UMB0905]
MPTEDAGAARARTYAPILDVIRVLAVIGVVVVHVIADHVPDGPVALTVLRALLATAVPAFVMLSGALNLSPVAMRHGSGPFLDRRLRRLLPATIVWTMFYAGIMQIVIAGQSADPAHVGRELVLADSYPHLYFLPLILGLTVITPVLAAYVSSSGRRAWTVGAVASVWTLLIAALPPLSEALLERPVTPLQLGTFTYFLPYIGYYVLGRAAWAAPVPRRTAGLLLSVGLPLLTAATVWAYLSPVTSSGAGVALLPTYLSPFVMALSLTLVIGVLSCGREWEVSERTESVLRRAGDATFGVFLLHFVVLVGLRGVGFPEDSALAVLALVVLVAVGSFALTLLGKQIPGVRALL